MSYSSTLNSYKFGIRWNSLELIITQGIYLIFQIFLYNQTSSKDFLSINAITSLMFFFVPLVNFGMDQAIIMYFDVYSKNRSSFNKFFISQIIIQVFLILFFLVGFFIADSYFHFLPTLLNRQLLVLLSFAFFAESIKKIFRTTLQVYFFNKETALVEIFSYFVFLATFLITRNTILSTFIFAAVSTFTLILIFLKHYSNIPIEGKIESVSTGELFTQRVIFSIYKIASLSQSSNLIIPLIIPMLNEQTGINVYFIKTLFGLLKYFSEKVLGVTTASLITRARQESKKIKELFINTSLSKIYNLSTNIILLFTGVMLFLVVFHKKLIAADACYSLSIYNAIALLFFIDVMPLLFIPQEKFILIEGKGIYLIIIKAVSFFTNIFSILFCAFFYAV